jgi:hypothetical protein
VGLIRVPERKKSQSEKDGRESTEDRAQIDDQGPNKPPLLTARCASSRVTAAALIAHCRQKRYDDPETRKNSRGNRHLAGVMAQ